MKKKILLAWLAGLLISGMATNASADLYTNNIYTVGASAPGVEAIGPEGFLEGVQTITWQFDVKTKGQATLSIWAEGVDSAPLTGGSGEMDAVYFNDELIGHLTPQGFYTGAFTLQPNQGILTGITGLSLSEFNVNAKAGINVVRVEVDRTEYWVNEIETSTLAVTPVPEPTTFLLFATGLTGLALMGRKKRN